ncbi:MAG: hypothetical protein HYZ50_01920 [Deltaproteobacteria bacterium]|nr:hypothetical protein [Deltaproteobacteria bacterium]
MTEKELFTRNLKLSTEFDLYLLEHPEVAAQIPENALIVLLPEEEPELCEKNLEMAATRREPGQPIVHIRVEKVAPPRSRLVNPRVEVAAG